MIDLSQVKTIQNEIVKRFMTPKQYEKFMLEYTAHKKSAPRETRLNRPIEEGDMELLRKYFTGSNMKEVADSKGIIVGTIYNRVYGTALRIVYKNRSLWEEVKPQSETIIK